jgi:hypothetical protein
MSSRATDVAMTVEEVQPWMQHSAEPSCAETAAEGRVTSHAVSPHESASLGNPLTGHSLIMTPKWPFSTAITLML